MTFDAYHKWLGIPPEEQPPNHYRLLGIEVFEDDREVISNATDRQMAHVHSFQSGPHSDVAQKLLDEIVDARNCLLNPDLKWDYDKTLRREFKGTAWPTQIVLGALAALVVLLVIAIAVAFTGRSSSPRDVAADLPTPATAKSAKQQPEARAPQQPKTGQEPAKGEGKQVKGVQEPVPPSAAAATPEHPAKAAEPDNDLAANRKAAPEPKAEVAPAAAPQPEQNDVGQVAKMADHAPPVIAPKAEEVKPPAQPEAAPPKAAVKQHITPALFRRKLRGRINYDPNTRVLTLYYDFKTARQLDDFDLQGNQPILQNGALILAPAQTIRHAVKFNTVAITGVLANKGQGTYLRTTGGVRATREGNWIGIYNASDGDRFHGAGENEANEYAVEVLPRSLRMRLGKGMVGKEITTPDGWSVGHIELCGGSSGAGFSMLMIRGEVDHEWAEVFLGLPQPLGPKDWVVVFKSSDPSVWNSNVKDESRFAIPLADVPNGIKYLRLTRMDKGEYVIVPVTKSKLGGLDVDGASGYGWNGTCSVQNKLRTLGVYARKAQATKSSPLDRPGVFFSLVEHGAGYSGWGFGHVNFKGDDKQYYGWAGEEISPTVFEIAVKGGSLSAEEEKHVLGR